MVEMLKYEEEKNTVYFWISQQPKNLDFSSFSFSSSVNLILNYSCKLIGQTEINNKKEGGKTSAHDYSIKTELMLSSKIYIKPKPLDIFVHKKILFKILTMGI